MLRRPKHAEWMILALLAGTVLTVFFTDVVIHVQNPTTDRLADVYRIPPTFGGDRIFFGSVLALLLSMSGMASAAMIEDARYLINATGSLKMPPKVVTINEMMLLLVVLLGVLPDALILLAWGEEAAPSSSLLAKIDRSLDAVSAVAFMAWLWRRTRSRPIMLFQLQKQAIPVDLELTWAQLRPKLIIALGIVVVSFGVAFGK